MKFSAANVEAFAWIGALILPAFVDPFAETHFSWCFFKNIGISWCPGCGLGKSLALLYRGNFSQSFFAHPLGIFAFLVLLNRIIILLKKNLTHSKANNHESKINEPHPRP
ncbi:MAG: DUF2752 domain-containing protein [Chitinophagaceae bacterium]